MNKGIKGLASSIEVTVLYSQTNSSLQHLVSRNHLTLKGQAICGKLDLIGNVNYPSPQCGVHPVSILHWITLKKDSSQGSPIISHDWPSALLRISLVVG